MKKIVFLIVVILTITGGAASAQGVWIGPGVPLQNALIQNATSLPCDFIAFGQPVGTLGPGQTAYLGPGGKKKQSILSKIISVRTGFGSYAGSDNIQIPIIARFFAEEHYVGEYDFILNVPGGGLSSSSAWIIRPGDVKCIDGAPCTIGLATNSAFGEKRVSIPFPSSWMTGMSGVQFINNSSLPLLVRSSLKFGSSETMKTGEVLYIATFGALVVSLKIDAIEPSTGSIVGAWNQDFNGQYSGFSAQNIVLSRGSFH